MRDRLYIKLEDKSLLYINYMFFDADPYLSPKVFFENGIKVKADKIFMNLEMEYKAVIVRVRKKDVPKFEKSMEDLKRTMLLMGHPNYEKEVSELLDKLETM